jgi:hypothetical protein
MAFPLSALEKWRSSSDKRASIENLHRNRRLEPAENRVWRCGPGARREMATIIFVTAAKDRLSAPAACRQKATRV